MRRFLSMVILFTFAVVMQMSFVHAIDMEIGRSIVVMAMSHTQEQEGNLCNEDTQTNTQSCFTEIRESKWIEIVRKIELTPFFSTLVFVFFASSLLYSASRISQKSLYHRVFYDPTLYLGLYGIIRNVN